MPEEADRLLGHFSQRSPRERKEMQGAFMMEDRQEPMDEYDAFLTELMGEEETDSEPAIPSAVSLTEAVDRLRLSGTRCYRVSYWYNGRHGDGLIDVECLAESERHAAQWFCDLYQRGDPQCSSRILNSIEECEWNPLAELAPPLQRAVSERAWQKEGF